MQNTANVWGFYHASMDLVAIAGVRHVMGGAQRGPVAAIGTAHWPVFLSVSTMVTVGAWKGIDA